MPCCALGTQLVLCLLLLIIILQSRTLHCVTVEETENRRATQLTQGHPASKRWGWHSISDVPGTEDDVLSISPWLLLLIVCLLYGPSGEHNLSVGHMVVLVHLNPMNHIPTELIKFLQCCLSRRSQFLISLSWGSTEPEMMPPLRLMRREGAGPLMA